MSVARIAFSVARRAPFRAAPMAPRTFSSFAARGTARPAIAPNLPMTTNIVEKDCSLTQTAA